MVALAYGGTCLRMGMGGMAPAYLGWRMRGSFSHRREFSQIRP